MSILRKALLTLAMATVMIGCCQLAQADPLVLSITSPLTAAAGSTVTFSATVTNTGTISTQTDTITQATGTFLSGVGSIDLGSFNFTTFNTNFLNQPVANGATLGPLAFFTFTVLNTNSPITGNFFFTYTNPSGATFSTNRASFAINAVPEPATMLLLGTGLVGIAAKLKRRKKAV